MITTLNLADPLYENEVKMFFFYNKICIKYTDRIFRYIVIIRHFGHSQQPLATLNIKRQL